MGCGYFKSEQKPGVAGWTTAARESRAMSIEALAEAAGLTLHRLKQLEGGASCQDSELERIANATNFPVKFFQRPAPEPHEGWMCGEGIVQCANCAFIAEYLCDYPMGGGKTCDAPLCERHGIEQGAEWDDLHFCPQHSLIERGAVREPSLL